MRLAGDEHFENRRHFFVAAGEAMRRVLVDRARHKLSAKRGGSAQRLPLSDVAAPDADERLLALDDALTQLAADDPLLARSSNCTTSRGCRTIGSRRLSIPPFMTLDRNGPTPGPGSKQPWKGSRRTVNDAEREK
jgi:hypothetical protein